MVGAITHDREARYFPKAKDTSVDAHCKAARGNFYLSTQESIGRHQQAHFRESTVDSLYYAHRALADQQSIVDRLPAESDFISMQDADNGALRHEEERGKLADMQKSLDTCLSNMPEQLVKEAKAKFEAAKAQGV